MREAVYYSEEKQNIAILIYDGKFKISSTRYYTNTNKDYLTVLPKQYDDLFKILSEEYTFIGYV